MTHTRTKALPYTDQRKWFFTLLSLLCVIFMLYAYFVITSVVEVVVRQEIEREIAAENSRISHLETQYIEAQHAVSAEIASQDGYVSIDRKIFIDRTPTTLVLSR